MPKKIEKDLVQLDLYELLDVDINSDEKSIKKAYRKHALSCHPDKNPNNPDAKDEFNKLKKILEILLDPGARSAYDKVLRGRKAAALRAKEYNAKNRKLRDALEERERKADLAKTYSKITEEERLKRELKRLEEEGERLIAEELEKVNQEAEDDLKKAFGSPQVKEAKKPGEGFRVKAKWVATDNWPGYTQEELQQLFYKWGEIFAIVMKQKGSKATALIEYKDKSGAEMATQFERGLPGKPVTVSSAYPEEKKPKKSHRPMGHLIKPEDYESVSETNAKRQEERRKLIEEMMKNDI